MLAYMIIWCSTIIATQSARPRLRPVKMFLSALHHCAGSFSSIAVVLMMALSTLPFNTAMNEVSSAELPFLDLGNDARVSANGKFFGVDDASVMLNETELPSFLPFPFGNGTETRIYISSNGLISFGASFTAFTPSSFPIIQRVVAPYWVDIDLHQKGLVLYAALIQGQESRLNNKLAIFNIVNGYITDTVIKGAVRFRARWILAVRWINVCPYGNSSCTLPNTFQAVLVTDGTRSYAIYTYECGKLNWADRFAGIGFSASSNFFAEHPLSRNSGVNEIACINKDSIPSSNWNNIVYEINVPTLSVSVSSNASTVLDISGYNSFTVQCGGTVSTSNQQSGVSLSFMLTKNSVSVTDGLSTSPVMTTGDTVSQSSSVQQTASSASPATLVYNCTVEFSISGSLITTASNTTQVIVKGPSLPAAPVVHQPPVTSPTSALIQWSVPVVTYSPEQYTVYYTTNSSGCPADSDEGYNKSVTVYGLNHTDFFTIMDQQYNITLTNLHPDTVYCYKVVATNTEGRSESMLRIFETNESIPSGSPVDFTVSDTSRTLALSWFPPLFSQRNGVIISYLITCSSGGSIINSTRTSSTSLIITGLQPFTSYNCSVSAATMVGDGPTAAASGVTDEDVPAGPPRQFFGIAENSTSIIVIWSAPATPNGVITEYQLQCSGGGQMFSRTVMGSQATTTLSGLLPYTSYSCNITAHTIVGGGPAATTSVITDESIPGKIKEINVTNAVTCIWDPPAVPNGLITGYQLNISTSSSTVFFIPNINPRDNMRTLSNLSPFVPYYISVAALTSKGKGEFETKVAFTLQGIPVSGPCDVQLMRLTSTQLAVRWKPLSLEEARGFITHYTVTADASTQRRRKAEGVFSITVGPNTTRAVLNGLSSVLTYWVTVSASTAVGTSTNNSRCLAELSAYSTPVCPSPLQDIVATSSISTSTQLITAVVVTFLLTCVSALVIGTLLGGLIMKRFLNAQAQSKLQKQACDEEPAERMYEMVNTERTVEAEYEIIDHDKKEVTLEDNSAYAIYTYHS